MNIFGQENNSNTIISPEVNADSSVTFRLYAPNARRVKVESDCFFRKTSNSWFGRETRKEKMAKDADGTWVLHSRSILPEVYQYRFVVDGKKIKDPHNPDSALILVHEESILAVGGNELADLYIAHADTPKGSIDTLNYYNYDQKVNRHVLVYRPYNTPTDSLPVLYLLHGISGDETSWIEQGRVLQIFDNLIFQEKIRPVLVVMPDCNTVRQVASGKRTNMIQSIFSYPFLQKEEFEYAFPELHRFICKKYNISNKQSEHFIAGLSSGAKQAANIVRDTPTIFGGIGIFTPAMMSKKQIPVIAEENIIQKEHMKYYIYGGMSDFFLKDSYKLDKKLKKSCYKSECIVFNLSHNWQCWRQSLVDFVETVLK